MVREVLARLEMSASEERRGRSVNWSTSRESLSRGEVRREDTHLEDFEGQGLSPREREAKELAVASMED